MGPPLDKANFLLIRDEICRGVMSHISITLQWNSFIGGVYVWDVPNKF